MKTISNSSIYIKELKIAYLLEYYYYFFLKKLSKKRKYLNVYTSSKTSLQTTQLVI